MSEGLSLWIALGIGVVLVFVVLRIAGSLVKALIVGALAAGALYLLLPDLEKQDGVVGEAAGQAREIGEAIEREVREAMEPDVDSGEAVDEAGSDEAPESPTAEEDKDDS